MHHLCQRICVFQGHLVVKYTEDRIVVLCEYKYGALVSEWECSAYIVLCDWVYGRDVLCIWCKVG